MDDTSRPSTRVLAPLGLVIVLLLLWQWYSTQSGISSTVLPSPMQVAHSGWDDRARLAANTLPTLRAALVGFTLSLVLGFALSVLIDFSRPARFAVEPLLVVSQTLPLVVVAPLLVLWFGFGLLPKVLLVALVTFFPITVSLVQGYATSASLGHDVMRSLGTTRWQEFTGLRLPSAMPLFFAGLRVAVTYAIIAAIFAEYAGSVDGLGIYMQVAKNSFRTDLVLAAVVVASVMTLVLYALTFGIERLATPWRARARDGVRDESQR